MRNKVISFFLMFAFALSLSVRFFVVPASADTTDNFYGTDFVLTCNNHNLTFEYNSAYDPYFSRYGTYFYIVVPDGRVFLFYSADNYVPSFITVNDSNGAYKTDYPILYLWVYSDMYAFENHYNEGFNGTHWLAYNQPTNYVDTSYLSNWMYVMDRACEREPRFGSAPNLGSITSDTTVQIGYHSRVSTVNVYGSAPPVSPVDYFQGEFSLNNTAHTLDFTYNINDVSYLGSLLNHIQFTFYDSNHDAVFSPASFVYSDGVTSDLMWSYIGDLDDNKYSWSYQSLNNAGLNWGETYTVVAYNHRANADASIWYSFAEFTFSMVSGDSAVSFFGGDMSLAINGFTHAYLTEQGSIIDADTGQTIDPNDISYSFNYNSDISDYPTTDFDVVYPESQPYSSDLVSSAGFVRKLFDEILDTMGLSGISVAFLSLAVASWFLFGKRIG